MILYSKLNFKEHLKPVLAKVNKTIDLIRKFWLRLPRIFSSTICKSFVRPDLDYGEVIHDKAHNELFHKKIASIQYNAAIAKNGAIKATSSEKLYQELGLEFLKLR